MRSKIFGFADVAVVILILAVLSLLPPALEAQVPVDQPAKPPAGAQAFTILSTAGTHGKGFIWTADDGSSVSRDSILLRGQAWELDQKVTLSRDGVPDTLVVRGRTPQGDAAETFHIEGGRATWKSPVDA